MHQQLSTRFEEAVVGGLALRSSLKMHNMAHVAFMGYDLVPLVQGGFRVTCERHQLRRLREPDNDHCRESTRRTRTPEPVIVR